MTIEKSLKDMFELTDKEESFVINYCVDFNGTRAAQVAGFSPENSKAAAVTASRLLRKPNIIKAIAYEKQRLAQTLNYQKEDLLRQNIELYSVNLDDIVTKIEAGDDLSIFEQRALTRLETNFAKDEDGVTRKIFKISIVSKEKIGELIGRMIGAFDDSVTLNPGEAWEQIFNSTKKMVENNPELKQQIEGKKEELRD